MNVNPYYPPPNQGGVPLPLILNDPPDYLDLANVEEYFDQLKQTRNRPYGPAATNEEIGRVAAYKAALSFATAPPPGVPLAAPPWVRHLYGFIGQMFHEAREETRVDLDQRFQGARIDLNQRFANVEERFANVEERFANVEERFDRLDDNLEAIRGEHAILLANSQAGHGAPLYDPTQPGQWAPLIAPNPTSRDNLMAFGYIECIASAAALRLPPLPADADLPARKRQIACKIGVAMG